MSERRARCAAMSYSSIRRQIKAQVAADMEIICSNVNPISVVPIGNADVKPSFMEALSTQACDNYVDLPDTCDVDDASMDACSHSPIAAASCRRLDFPEFTSDGSEDSNLSEQLANWAVRFSIPLSATGALLNVLQQYHPSCHVTLELF